MYNARMNPWLGFIKKVWVKRKENKND